MQKTSASHCMYEIIFMESFVRKLSEVVKMTLRGFFAS